jgi:hypothetical protein
LSCTSGDESLAPVTLELIREHWEKDDVAHEAPAPRLTATVDAIEKLGWDDMKMIFATQFASEMTAVTEGGGDALLRERVASLDTDQRQLLREALEKVETRRRIA